MIYVLLIIIGLILGSFFLVIATRMPNEESVIFSRSHCDNCKHILKWYELIPLLSYIIQKGRCKKCGARISFLAPLSELYMAASLSAAYYIYGISYSFFTISILLSIMLIIFVSDFKYFIINDEPLFASIIAVLVLKYIYFGLKPLGLAILSGMAMFFIFYFVKVFGDKAFKKESLGGGDIKLAILIGVVLGVKLGLTAFIISAFIALPYAVIASKKNKEGLVPYGPFLIISLVIVFIFMNNFIDIINYLFAF